MEETMFDLSSLATKAAAALKDEILSGRLQPNERIDLKKYTSAWSISATPLRAAAMHLESIGLVRVLPRRGVFVSQISTRKEFKNIIELRMALEELAIRLATPRIPESVAQETLALYCKARDKGNQAGSAFLSKIDARIHEVAQQYCDNRRLQKIMVDVRDLFKWSRQTIIRHIEHPYEATLSEHIRICEAVCARDPQAAAEAMHSHLENTWRRFEEFLASTTAASSVNDGQPSAGAARHPSSRGGD
jgi:DNA-binding GntR family transcriptional regulator